MTGKAPAGQKKQLYDNAGPVPVPLCQVPYKSVAWLHNPSDLVPRPSRFGLALPFVCLTSSEPLVLAETKSPDSETQWHT